MSSVDNVTLFTKAKVGLSCVTSWLQWTVSAQRELGWHVLVDAGAAGRGEHGVKEGAGAVESVGLQHCGAPPRRDRRYYIAKHEGTDMAVRCGF